MTVARFLPVLPQGSGPWVEWELRSNTARTESPLTRTTKTLSRGGDRWAAKFRFENLSGANRYKVLQFLWALRGGGGRFYAYDPIHDLRGSFPATELFTNNEFASGTTGWSDNQSTLKDSDLGIRLMPNRSATNPYIYQNVSLPTSYVQYALCAIDHEGKGFSGISVGPQIWDGVGSPVTASSTSRGFKVASLVSRGTALGAEIPLYVNSQTGFVRGDYLDLSYCSLSRCVSIDNGPNYCQYSDQLDNAAWTKSQASISANAVAAPDGTTTADEIIEDSTASSQHLVSQGSIARTNEAAACVVFGWFKQGSGDRDIYILVDDGSGNGVACPFDLSAGTAGTPVNNGTASEARAFIQSDSNGWYFCAVVGRLPATAVMGVGIYLYNGGVSYNGDGSSSVYGWRIGCAVGGLPTRGMQTTSANDTDGTLQTGNGLYVAGLPASTDGLLLPGDWIQIITPSGSELKRIVSSLDSDALGLGFLQFEPMLSESPVHGSPIIVRKPLGRFLLDENSVTWPETADNTSTIEFTAVEDVVA